MINGPRQLYAADIKHCGVCKSMDILLPESVLYIAHAQRPERSFGIGGTNATMLANAAANAWGLKASIGACK